MAGQWQPRIRPPSSSAHRLRYDTHVLVLLDSVPRAPVAVTVPDDLGALREAVEVEAGTGNSTTNDAGG